MGVFKTIIQVPGIIIRDIQMLGFTRGLVPENRAAAVPPLILLRIPGKTVVFWGKTVMHNLQIRRKGIRQPSSSKSSRRYLAITGDLDQILSKYHSYNLSQVIKHSSGGNDSNMFSIHF